MCRRLLCYGDSNTYGYDPRSYLGGRYPESIRWTALLKGCGWKVHNAGENGRSIPRSDREIDIAVQALCRMDADILTVMLGSNDLLQCPGLTAENCGGRMERFLTSLLTKTHVAHKIVLVAPPPMELGAWVSDQRTIDTSHQLAGCYEVATHRLGIDFADAGVWGVELSYDGVHFSEKGHLAFAQGMQATLDTLR